jgi:hypothetical protein
VEVTMERFTRPRSPYLRELIERAAMWNLRRRVRAAVPIEPEHLEPPVRVGEKEKAED